MKMLIDADACPRSVLAISHELGVEYDIPVWTVASFDHVINSDHHIVVGDGSQEADIKIANLAQSGDVVITQDWGLAAMVLAKGARSLSPSGKVFRPDMISFLLQERDLKARVRRSGGRTKGPKRRTAEDDRRFRTELHQIILELTNQ
ncbi:MAG: YaiI/YqxD family protein [Solirubrobacterales bacterium]